MPVIARSDIDGGTVFGDLQLVETTAAEHQAAGVDVGVAGNGHVTTAFDGKGDPHLCQSLDCVGHLICAVWLEDTCWSKPRAGCPVVYHSSLQNSDQR